MASVLTAGPVPALYHDPAYVKSGGNGNFVISTSNVSGYEWLYGGFAPMVPSGLGICYAIEPQYIGATITSKRCLDENKKQDSTLRARVDCHAFADQLAKSLAFVAAYILEASSRNGASHNGIYMYMHMYRIYLSVRWVSAPKGHGTNDRALLARQQIMCVIYFLFGSMYKKGNSC
jgi:hypothetical protein